MSTEDCEEVIVKSDPVSCTSVGSDSVHLKKDCFLGLKMQPRDFVLRGLTKGQDGLGLHLQSVHRGVPSVAKAPKQ